jgi:hypothetical protein
MGRKCTWILAEISYRKSQDTSLPSALHTRKLLLPPVSVGEIRAHAFPISEDTLILRQFLAELLPAMAYGLILTCMDGVVRSAAVEKVL